MNNVIIIGGGASGFFTAINAKEQNPNLNITILEKGKNVLQKVKISGGGRCNVTHACFEPKELTSFYPRGQKELLGPFHQFMTGDTFEWFEKHGVPIKIEEDGRAFPETNSSQTIIDCFLKLAKKLNIKVITNCGVSNFYPNSDKWNIETKSDTFIADKLIIACGSNKKIWTISQKLNHTIIQPVPSLFTFNIKDKRILDLGGISVPNATIKISGTKLESNGSLLITHWGLSGPAILKLSAFGARILADKNYEYEVEVNWLSITKPNIVEQINDFKKNNTRKQVSLKSPFSEISKRLWERLVSASKITLNQNWSDLSNLQIENLANQLSKCNFKANGKSTFKEEFVTAGGIDLKEINFKSFESKLHKNLYFVGEVLNIDAITGGFNFQNAWTSGFICASNISN